jgi:hypothetical protein
MSLPEIDDGAIRASGGTDAGDMLLFWPDNMPEDADSWMEGGDPIPMIESLRAEGKLIWFPCDSDGGYSVSIYVRTEIPGPIAKHCVDEEVIDRLLVRGRGYFGGGEYAFKRNDRMMKKYPGMCEQVDIPEGDYSARLYRIETPDGFDDDWLLENAGVPPATAWSLHATFMAMTVMAVMASLASLCFVGWTFWPLVGCVAAAILFGTTAALICRTKSFRDAAAAQRVFERMFPAYVVALEGCKSVEP